MNAADGCMTILAVIVGAFFLLAGMGYLFELGFIGLVINLGIIYIIYRWIKYGIK